MARGEDCSSCKFRYMAFKAKKNLCPLKGYSSVGPTAWCPTYQAETMSETEAGKKAITERKVRSKLKE